VSPNPFTKSSKERPRTAAELLLDQLAINGVKHVSCVPGESYLPVLDALYGRDIALTVCRQEGGAAMMAAAIGKATGEPGICFVSRGPGATNASIGVHIARQDSDPMILFVGQVKRGARGREALQELDYRAVFGDMAKWATEIDDGARIPEIVSRAFHIARSGRPGPVVIALPEDMLSEPVNVEPVPPIALDGPSPSTSEMENVRALLARAQRPIVIVGGSRWSDDARTALHRFAEAFGLPVTTSYRRLTLFDPLHPNYAGDLGIGPNPKLITRLQRADLVLLIGGRLGEIPSQGYGLFDIPRPRAVFIHVYPEADELGRVYHPRLAIQATSNAFIAGAARLEPPSSIRWRGEAEAAHADYLAWTEQATDQPGKVNLGEVMIWLRKRLPPDAILCNGAGNYAAWIHRFYRFRKLGTHVAPLAAAMGYGVPAAIAMKRLYPERRVISLNGDGDFLMNGQEFATAVQYRLPIIVVVCDNCGYGTIRMHQEREFPARVIGTSLVNPDFAAYARCFGGVGFTVEATKDFAEAFRAAEESGRPAIIHLKLDPDAATPAASFSQIRARAMQSREAIASARPVSSDADP
jgi:acetolactate synthase-1/2/3 large subunit